MSWVQLKLRLDSKQAEQIEAALNQTGALAVTITDAADQALFEPPLGTTPLWDESIIVGLFPADVDVTALQTGLKEQLGESLSHWQVEILEDQDWTRAWQDDFKPMRFGERVWICPSVYTPPEPNAINILLDPGLAFGTGTHPTTAMCLTWLDRHPPQAKTVIDYGCGSGILALAAGKLGAKRVLAVDNDPQALLATRENSAHNQLGDCIETFLPETLPKLQCDLLLANILAGPLIELAPVFHALVKPGGELVLSGLLENQAENIIHAYQGLFTLGVVQQQEEWLCLHGTRET